MLNNSKINVNKFVTALTKRKRLCCLVLKQKEKTWKVKCGNINNYCCLQSVVPGGSSFAAMIIFIFLFFNYYKILTTNLRTYKELYP